MARSSKRRRPSTSSKITLYDAVAGRASYEGFISAQPLPSNGRDTTSGNSNDPVPADEILFSKRGAPERFQENDIYFADRHLGPEQRLPDEALLKALHRYVADFYGVKGDGRDVGSLEETALLALGILVEEMVEEAMGESGGLALLEEAVQDGT